MDAARSVQMKFEPRNVQPGNGREAWLVLKTKYQDTSCQRRRTLLWWLDNSAMRSDIDPNVFLSEVFQLRDEIIDLDEIVSNRRLTTTILYAVSEEVYSTVKVQSIREPNLRLQEITSIMATIFINHSERSSVPKRSQESYRQIWNSRPEQRMRDNLRESAMTFTCHN